MNPILRQLLEHDQPRWQMFARALRYVDYEDVPGDVLEFGCYTGRSLALLSHATHHGDHRTTHAVRQSRRVHGYDSWQGMPDGSGHPRWPAGKFLHNESWHPILHPGEIVTHGSVLDLFSRSELPPPVLHVGDYSRLPPGEPLTAAVIHVDCDLYESTVQVLDYVYPLLQPGSVILFDDWFHYCANPKHGEHRAFDERSAAHRDWCLIPWQPYATFGFAWIATRGA